MPSHAIFVNGSRIPCVIQPVTDPYRPARGASKWRVREVPDGYVVNSMEDPNKYPTVDYYNPASPTQMRAQTPYKGSWAESMARGAK